MRTYHHVHARHVPVAPPRGWIVLGLAVSSWALVALVAMSVMRLVG